MERREGIENEERREEGEMRIDENTFQILQINVYQSSKCNIA